MLQKYRLLNISQYKFKWEKHAIYLFSLFHFIFSQPDLLIYKVLQMGKNGKMIKIHVLFSK